MKIEYNGKEYDLPGIVEDHYLLKCLFEAGVENWDGFDQALKTFMETCDD